MKIVSLQCAWIKRLYGQRFNDWKVISLKLTDNTSDNNFKFHSNLDFDVSSLRSFPNFYRTILQSWKNRFSHIFNTVSSIKSQFLWFNEDVRLLKILKIKDFSKKIGCIFW